MPAFKPVDLQAVQNRTVTGNTAILPEVIGQASTINQAQFEQTNRMLEQASGGWYGKALAKVQANTDKLLAGGDLQDVLAGSAASNLYRGVAGTGFGAYGTAKRTADEVTKNRLAGESSFYRWLAAANQIYQPVNIEGMFARNSITPQFGAQFAAEERDAQFQRDYVENQWKWYNSFGQKAVRFEDSIMQLAGDIAGAAKG